MKKIVSLFLLSFAVSSWSAPSADGLLAFVRDHLPKEPLELTGTLKVQAKNGFVQARQPVQIRLNWGANPPAANYKIGEESMQVIWKNKTPEYHFSNPKNRPQSPILKTGFTWADLSFAVLWWPNSKLIGEGRKINRACQIVEVPVPDSDLKMQLWIEKKMGMLLEAQTLNASGKMIRRLKIKSIKKMDDLWVAKDLELLNAETGTKTLLKITDLQREALPAIVQECEIKEEEIPAISPADAVNRAGFNLYQALAKETSENLFFSPYSISSALAMTYAGARKETATQMQKTLSFPSIEATPPLFAFLQQKMADITQSGEIELLPANALWPQKGEPLQSDYLATIKEFFRAEITPLDYTHPEAARKIINAWVEEQTQNLIKNLVPAGILNAATRLVLVNAIYFKGTWQHPFNPKSTRPRSFFCADGTTNTVPTMTQTGSFKIAKTATFQALELPYKGEQLSMLILLPNPKTDLKEIEEKMTPEQISQLEFQSKQTMISLPRFKLETSFQLSKTLSEMGMPLAFSEKADFSGMDAKQDLSIGAVLHKAFVEVNETGTEAAAATAVLMQRTSLPSFFRINRPFLFLIRENSTGTILFLGRIHRLGSEKK